MNLSVLTFSKSLLKRFDRDLDHFEDFFCDDLKEAFRTSIDRPVRSFQEELAQKHYSYFVKSFEGLELDDYGYYLAVLPQGVRLAQLMGHQSQFPNLKPFAKRFFLQAWREILSKRRAPLFETQIPRASLDPLLALNKKQLVKLIDFLSLFDLKIELARLGSKTFQEHVEKLLSEKKRQALASISLQEDAQALSDLRLKEWDGNQEKLMRILHQSGLCRFAQAFDQDLLFYYLCSKLDTGRAFVLEKHFDPAKASEEIQAQILFINDILFTQEAA